MRTTLRLDPDVVAAIDRYRTDSGAGLSDAVNDLVRRGLTHTPTEERYTLEPVSLDAWFDYTNIGETLALLDEWEREDHRAD